MERIGFTLLYFKMAVIPLVPETNMADVGKLINLGDLFGQESHVMCAHNYVCIFDFVPRIWSRPHDKDCLYIFSSFTFSLTDSTLSLSPFRLTETAHSLSLSLSHTF